MVEELDRYESQAHDLEKYLEMRDFFSGAANREELNTMVMPYILDLSYDRHDITLAMGYVIHAFERVERRLAAMKQTFVVDSVDD